MAISITHVFLPPIGDEPKVILVSGYYSRNQITIVSRTSKEYYKRIHYICWKIEVNVVDSVQLYAVAVALIR